MFALRNCIQDRPVSWLAVLLLLSGTAAIQAAEPADGRLPALANDEAWRRLPGAPEQVQRLPDWARRLAGPLPMTTARMLELDAAHRTGDRLDARLRGLARWAAADANDCAYARRVAIQDLMRAGVANASIPPLADPGKLPLVEQLAMRFAKRMMCEAHEVTDEEVARLIDVLGEERVVALVALVAHASFQDRVLLALDAQIESEGPMPPLAMHFELPDREPKARQAASKEPKEEVDSPTDEAIQPPAWIQLQMGLANQRHRSSRIRIPSREEMLRQIGDKHPAAWQSDILWSRVCYAHQPELTDAWFSSVAAFREEAKLPRVLQQCLFWVVTESVQCYY